MKNDELVDKIEVILGYLQASEAWDKFHWYEGMDKEKYHEINTKMLETISESEPMIDVVIYDITQPAQSLDDQETGDFPDEIAEVYHSGLMLYTDLINLRYGEWWNGSASTLESTDWVSSHPYENHHTGEETYKTIKVRESDEVCKHIYEIFLSND